MTKQDNMTMDLFCQSPIQIQDNISVRKIAHKGEWFFSVVDTVEYLTGSPTPKTYWGKMKERFFLKNGSDIMNHIERISLPSKDGKKYKTDCATKETLEKICKYIPKLKIDKISKRKDKLISCHKNRTDSLIKRDSKQYQMIENIFNSCPYGFVVDHIIPLKGENVCGLNVPWNLQVVPREYNASKSNKYNPEIYTEQADRSLEFYNIVTQFIISEHSRKNIIDFYEEKGKRDLSRILNPK